MLMSNDFIKAEDKYRREIYRREVLADQCPKQKSTAGRAGFAIVVAAILLAMVLAACGTPEETGAQAVGSAQSVRDVSPTGEPNRTLVDSILDGYAGDFGAVIGPEYGGLTAPSWEPNYGRLKATLEALNGEQQEEQTVGNLEPVGTPNYGLLQSIIGAEPTSGPR